MASYTRKAALGFAWVAGGAVLAMLFGYLTRITLARTLPVASYGLVYAVLALFGLVGIFQHLGLGEAITKYVASYTVRKDDASIRGVLLWSLVMLSVSTLALVAFSFLFSNWLGLSYFKSDDAALLIRIYAVSTFFSTGIIILLSFLQGKQRMDLHASVLFAQSAVLFGAMFLFLRLGAGVAAIMYGYVMTYLILYAIFVPIVLRAFPTIFSRKIVCDTKIPKMLITYGLPVMLTLVAGIFLQYTDTGILTLFRSLEEVGLYQAAIPTANILLFLVSAINVVLFPLFAELWEHGKKNVMREALTQLSGYIAIIVFPLVAAVVVYPDVLLNLLFGSAYIAAAPSLRLLACSALFLTFQGLNAAALSGIGMPGKTTRAVVAGALLNVVLNFLLIPRYGGPGAAAATLVSSALIFALTMIFLRRQLRFRLPLYSWLRTLLASCVFLLILVASRATDIGMNQYLKIVLSVGVAGVVYLGLLIALGVLVWRDVRELLERVLTR